MYQLIIQEQELFNDVTYEFIQVKPTKLQLEHSLVSISKWESKHKKSFLYTENMTNDELIDYIRCMTITQNVDPNVYYCITEKQYKEICEYMADPMTATTFSKDSKKSGVSAQIITAELIYYWMIECGIPKEFEKWHFNRLMTLIRVCKIKMSPPSKMTAQEAADRNRRLNEERLKKYGVRG